MAGARHDDVLEPFDVRGEDLDVVQYGSDETKTHRKIKHILGQKQAGRVGRLLVSELFTVGTGGWSGFPSHKHDTDRLPDETDTTKPTISVSARITDRVCKCCSEKTTSPATPTTWSTVPPSASTTGTTLAWSCRATRCTISPFSAD